MARSDTKGGAINHVPRIRVSTDKEGYSVLPSSRFEARRRLFIGATPAGQSNQPPASDAPTLVPISVLVATLNDLIETSGQSGLVEAIL